MCVLRTLTVKPSSGSRRRFSGPPLTISIGRRWMLTYRFSRYAIRLHSRWFHAPWTNNLLSTGKNADRPRFKQRMAIWLGAEFVSG